MIPTTNAILNEKIVIKTMPSKNYKMHFDEGTINGYRDELDAMKQVVYKILDTERYQYLIYSWNFGVELSDLFGQPVSYVCGELERRIKEALVQDDRINSVDSFSFDTSKRHIISVTCVAHTIFGSLDVKKEVDY